MARIVTYYILIIVTLFGLSQCASIVSTVSTFPHDAKIQDNISSQNTDQHSHVHDNNASVHGNESHDDHEDGDHHHGIHVASWNFHYVQQPLIIAVFLLTAGIVKLGFHHADLLSSHIPESCCLIILGIVVGGILHVTLTDKEEFPGMTSDLFFLYLLPPIILESAYSLHDRTFYENVGTVLVYAVMGTVLNCFLIGPSLYVLASLGAMGSINISFIQCLVFSAIIIAVDPVAVLAIFQEIGVNNVLYFLVFGESLLNDAVTVVLYNMMKEFNKMSSIPATQIFLGITSFFVVSFGGLAVGILFGVLTAIMTRYTEHVRVMEPLAVFVLAYTSYLVAEMFHFSGIISIIACGLTQAQYAFRNISTKSSTTVKYFSKMMSSTCDCVIFMFLGLVIFNPSIMQHESWHIGFIFWTILLCLVYRFLVVFGLTFVLNKLNRLRRIDLEEQFIMAYGGLRGAVAFSLVDLLTQKSLPINMFMTTTVIVIFFTVFVQGISIKPLVRFLRVSLQEKEELSISEEINTHVTDHVMAGIEEVLGQRGEHYVRELLEYYDRKYLKKWLQNDPGTVDEHIMELFEKIALKTHFENLAGSKMIQEKYGSTLGLNTDLTSISEEEEEEEPSDMTRFLLPKLPSIDAFDEEIDMLRDKAEKQRPVGPQDRRKSLIPGLSKRRGGLIENPTAEDIRKMITPVRREMRHCKLDRNLKDDNNIDLLRYLQEKQLRQRRMSRCVIVASPRSSNINLNMPKSPRIDADRAMLNYRRRLSLAVTVGQGSDSPHLLAPPHKRKLRKSHTVGFDPDEQSEQELSPLVKDTTPLSSNESSPNKSEMDAVPLAAISESEEREWEPNLKKEHKSRRTRLQKAHSVGSNEIPENDKSRQASDSKPITESPPHQGQTDQFHGDMASQISPSHSVTFNDQDEIELENMKENR